MEATTEKTIEQQVRDGWRAYYVLIALGTDEALRSAKRVFDRTVELSEAAERRRTTLRFCRRAIETVEALGGGR